MRRAVWIGAGVVVVAAAGALALALPVASTTQGGPHITRLFIPAIKDDCRQRALVPADAIIGYTFTPEGAVTTIDHGGELTGVEPGILADFNACMAQYPIEPIAETPRDHYNRNLLYDYLSGTLRPCLAGRVSELPPMPSRADFVVRLYAWDPYRFLAPDRPLQQLLELAVQCPALPTWLDGD